MNLMSPNLHETYDWTHQKECLPEDEDHSVEKIYDFKTFKQSVGQRPFVSWARWRKDWIIEQTSSKLVDR